MRCLLLLLIGCGGKGASDTGTASDTADSPLDTAEVGEDCTPTEEVCDGEDNDCDGEIDEGVTTTAYVDADGDGFGDPDTAQAVCTVPSGIAESRSSLRVWMRPRSMRCTHMEHFSMTPRERTVTSGLAAIFSTSLPGCSVSSL